MVMVPMANPSTAILLRNFPVRIDSFAALGLSFITSLSEGSTPSAMAGRLSVRRLMNS